MRRVVGIILLLSVIGCSSENKPANGGGPKNPDPPSKVGGVDGGGGRSLVCRNQQQNIQNIQFFDLYEAQVLEERDFVYKERDLSEWIDWIAKRSKNEGLKYLATHVQSKMKLVAAELLRIDDLNTIIAPPQGCEFEQTANFFSTDKIYVNKEHWAEMTNFDRAALIYHEAIYWQARNLGANDSRRSRSVVGMLFDDSALVEPIDQDVPMDATLCYSALEPNKEVEYGSGYMFWVYDSPQISGSKRFQFQVKGSEFVFSAMSVDVRDFNPEEIGRVFPGDDDLGLIWSVSTFASSNFEDRDIFVISKHKMPIKDYGTGQIIPGYHTIGYTIEGVSGSDDSKKFKSSQIFCNVD